MTMTIEQTREIGNVTGLDRTDILNKLSEKLGMDVVNVHTRRNGNSGTRKHLVDTDGLTYYDISVKQNKKTGLVEMKFFSSFDVDYKNPTQSSIFCEMSRSKWKINYCLNGTDLVNEVEFKL